MGCLIVLVIAFVVACGVIAATYGYLTVFVVVCVVASVVTAGIYTAIQSLTLAKRRRKLDEIARDVLAEFDFDKERGEIKSIGSRYVSKEYRCPRCNGMLLMRNGIYGKFWGCNHYPKCKYTRSIR